MKRFFSFYLIFMLSTFSGMLIAEELESGSVSTIIVENEVIEDVVPEGGIETDDAAAEDIVVAEDIVEEVVIIPFETLPYAARMELNEAFLIVWETLDQEGRLKDAQYMLLDYLRTPEGQKITRSGFLDNSYMYYVLLAKSRLLAGFLSKMDGIKNKGLRWFSQGMIRIYENKSAQASSNFAKGIFSSLQLDEADYQHLIDAGVKIRYFPTMTAYSNAAFIATRFLKVSYQEQQTILNIAMAKKVTELELIPADILMPKSESYQLQALYYNLGAYLVLESYQDSYSVRQFLDEPDDLFNILQEKFGYDAREIFERY